jgi:excisionase family DNA binding protein
VNALPSVSPLTPTTKRAGTMTASHLEPLMTAEDVAAYLRASKSMVYKLAESAELPCLRIGTLLRFERDTVQRFARGEIRGEPEGRVVEINRRAA